MPYMQFNPLLFPLVPLAIVAFIGGVLLAGRLRSPGWMMLAFAGALLLAAPGVLFTLYYFHWFDQWKLFYEFRTLPYSELSAAGMGVLAGMLPSLARKRRLLHLVSETGCLVLLICWLSVPYLKMMLGPVDLTQFKEDYFEGVCLQSTDSSCGPASAVTVARRQGKLLKEKQLARESFTSMSGTECWYLARALQKNGLTVNYVFLPPSPDKLVKNSIAGVRLGGPTGLGHFVAVMGETRKSYIIGDPSKGRAVVKKSEIGKGYYYFTGFFLQVENR